MVKLEKVAKLHFYFYTYRRDRRKNILDHKEMGESSAVNKREWVRRGPEVYTKEGSRKCRYEDYI